MKPRDRDVTMMTKRSNHIPTLMRIETPTSIHGVVRARLNQSAWGTTTLHKSMVQNAHAYGPRARLTRVNFSWGLPEYHAMKNSMPYEYATIRPVASVILAMFSRWRVVISSSRWKKERTGMRSVSTIAKPEKMAPATK